MHVVCGVLEIITLLNPDIHNQILMSDFQEIPDQISDQRHHFLLSVSNQQEEAGGKLDDQDGQDSLLKESLLKDSFSMTKYH